MTENVFQNDSEHSEDTKCGFSKQNSHFYRFFKLQKSRKISLLSAENNGEPKNKISIFCQKIDFWKSKCWFSAWFPLEMPCHGILHNPCESKNAILRVLGLPRAKLTPETCSLGQNRVLKILVFLVKIPVLLPDDFSILGQGIGLKTHISTFADDSFHTTSAKLWNSIRNRLELGQIMKCSHAFSWLYNLNDWKRNVLESFLLRRSWLALSGTA